MQERVERQTRYARCARYIRSCLYAGCMNSALQKLVNTVADMAGVPRSQRSFWFRAVRVRQSPACNQPPPQWERARESILNNVTLRLSCLCVVVGVDTDIIHGDLSWPVARAKFARTIVRKSRERKCLEYNIYENWDADLCSAILYSKRVRDNCYINFSEM